MNDHTTKRIEIILRKIVEHADDGLGGSSAYAIDRLTRIRAIAAHGIERVLKDDCQIVDNWTLQ